jgi:TPP-dependent 2-oxoacid decarboxylase
MRFVEMAMPWDDAPATLKALASATADTNSKTE